MQLYFITGNKGKFEEAKGIFPNIIQFDIDLPEIQEIDPKKIIEAKLDEAIKHKKGNLIVSDTSIEFDCINGLPGPLSKWFLKVMKPKELWELCSKYQNFRAKVVETIGFEYETGEIKYFEGIVEGIITEPKGENGFGWDPIFKPNGSNKTYAEMSLEEKNFISHRQKALRLLKEYLEH